MGLDQFCLWHRKTIFHCPLRPMNKTIGGNTWIRAGISEVTAFAPRRRAMIFRRRSSVGLTLGFGKVVNVRDLRAFIASSIS
jgi:hypothetical protein